jgi:signal transduction histidine kinase
MRRPVEHSTASRLARLRRDPYGVLTIAVVIAALGYTAAFLWLRAMEPSEPAVISSDDWPWTARGVAVRPLRDGPFEAGDVVVAIDGRAMESWAATAVQPFARERPSGLPSVVRFDVVRNDRTLGLDVPLERRSLVELLAPGFGLLAFTIGQLAIAALAFLRRPAEGWRRGFLLGSVGNLASAVAWELGLQPTDLVRGGPAFALFTVTGPLHLLFWSSVVHFIGSFPGRSDIFARRPAVVAALYGLPQIALPAGIALAGLLATSTLLWIDHWATVLASIVLVMLVLTIGATVNAYRHWPAPQRSQILPLALTIIGTAIAVLGLTVVPVLAAGRPLAARAAVAILGLPAVVALIVAVVRYRLFEVAVLDASRRRLIVAREEERRRIRRDLHDGLGPMLAAMTLKLDLTREQVRADPQGAETMLDELKADTRTAVGEIRRLVRELRPPALDELGLADAIRQRAAELGTTESTGDSADTANTSVSIVVDSPSLLPSLSAAVEVAAYRIAVEAMTNVIRHSGAQHCIVRLSAHRELEVDVLDDGIGIDPTSPAGVGLSSMRERSAELGGSCSIDRSSDGWTRVSARFPIRI